MNESRQRLYNFIKKNSLRIVLCLCLAAGIVGATVKVVAMYRAKLNGFTTVIAKEYYFSSNFLKVEPAHYLVNGWSGNNQAIGELEIRNYENTLLTNQEGQDLSYEMTWEVSLHDENDDPKTIVGVNDPYKVKLVYSDIDDGTFKNTSIRFTDMSKEPNEDYEEKTTHIVTTKGRVTGRINGNGESKRDIFHVSLEKNGDWDADTLLKQDDYVLIKMTATNAGNNRNQYRRTLTAEFRYRVSQLDEFIRDFSIKEETDYITTNIQTNIDPSTSPSGQKIYMWWDLEYLGVNHFDYQFNQLYMADKYQVIKHNNREFGQVEITAGSLASISIQLINLKNTDFVRQDSTDYLHLLRHGSYTKANPPVENDQDSGHFIGYYMDKDISADSGTE